MSSDSQAVEVRQVPEGLRSSSPVFQAQIDYNLWTGSFCSLPILGRDADQVVANGVPLLNSGEVFHREYSVRIIRCKCIGFILAVLHVG